MPRSDNYNNCNNDKCNDIQENFDFAVEQIRNSNADSNNKFIKTPTNEEKLKFYGLYKQATIGKCNTQRPWNIQMVECAKWDAWNSLGNMTKENAMIKYCALYTQIIA